jgi:carboxymethylenebutenolidase
MDRTSYPDLGRRDFLAAAIATGFALAVRPISAQTLILTDSSGIVADQVRIPADGVFLPAYMAHPEQGGQWPLLLVVQEIFGVHEHIKDVCRRLAKLGYLAIAPELFFRQGDVSQLKEIGDIVATVVSKVPDAQVMVDLDATVDWAKRSGMAQAGQLGITGFCWGGRITWLYAAHNPQIKAGVAWYGRLDGAGSELQPTYPFDVAKELKGPVLGLYGGADQGIPLESVERMRVALASKNNGSDIVVYPDTPHAFFADYRPSYRKEAAEDGWRRLQSWFVTHGLAPAAGK